MSKKDKRIIVYSTNPNWTPEIEEENDDTLASNQQVLRVRLETKQRAGKKATIIHGFMGNEDDLNSLAKTLKTKLGVGGSVKDGEIMIQGDYVSKAKELLIQLGYKNTK